MRPGLPRTTATTSSGTCRTSSGWRGSRRDPRSSFALAQVRVPRQRAVAVVPLPVERAEEDHAVLEPRVARLAGTPVRVIQRLAGFPAPGSDAAGIGAAD